MASLSAYTKTLRVESAATESASFCCDDDTLVGFYAPASIDAGTLTLQASENGTTWFSVSMDAITLAASTYFPIDPVITIGMKYFRLKQSGAAAANRDYVCRLRAV